MKKNSVNKKLVLNKTTITNLDAQKMDSVKGGTAITLVGGACATVKTTEITTIETIETTDTLISIACTTV